MAEQGDCTVFPQHVFYPREHELFAAMGRHHFKGTWKTDWNYVAPSARQAQVHGERIDFEVRKIEGVETRRLQRLPT